MTTDEKYIKNFAVITHTDHGQFALFDRLIEYCGTTRRNFWI